MREEATLGFLLSEQHRALQKLILLHQQSLVSWKLEEAQGFLGDFEQELKKHIRVEDDLLFPLYCEMAPHPAGGAPEFFEIEHQKILWYLQRLSEKLNHLLSLPDSSERCLLLIAIIEEESRFKHLMEHHELREENIMYPLLDRRLDPEKREEVLATLRNISG